MGIQIGYRQRQIETLQLPKIAIPPRVILRAVADHTGISQDTMAAKTRRKEVVMARHMAMYLLCTMTEATLERIGQMFGDRDHTTTLHARDKIQHLIVTKKDVATRMEYLREVITGEHDKMISTRMEAVLSINKPNTRRSDGITRRPAAEYSNSGHLNLLKRLA
jgi:hypothetical protein